MTVDFTEVQIPADLGGFERVIFIPKGLTITAVAKAMRKKNITIKITDEADEILKGRNVRETDHDYAVRFRDRQEADEELKDHSFIQLKADNINSITLLERLVYELKYWSETEGDHLDVVNITLCAGSRCSDGCVPGVRWSSALRKLHVYWCFPDFARGDLRARQAVSK